MKFSLAIIAALAPFVAAQNASTYLTTVLGALQGAGLTSLVSVASAIANTTNGQALLGALAVGNKTVFAPNNAAFAAVPSSVSSNTDLLTQVLAYHILNASYTLNGTAIAPNHTIARTTLYGGNYTLPNNRTAPMVLARNNASAMNFQIVQATSNVTAQGPVAAANLLVYVIDQVLSLPPTLSGLAGQLFGSLASVIQMSGLLAPLQASQAITVFAPNDAAISAIASSLGSINATMLQTILANHVINGSVVYSTLLTSANYTSAAGSPFTFMSNTTGTYVMSGNSTARIVQSDLIINNGVVHLIDGVLLNAMMNATAAASAYMSATSAAAANTADQTGVISTTSAPATSSTSKAAAGQAISLDMTKGAMAALVGVVGLAVGGGLVLA